MTTSPRGRRDTRLRRRVQRWIMAAHRSAYRLSSGRIGGTIGSNRVAVLTTVGRRSGKPRSAPIFAYPDGDDYLIVASNGGTARPPQWVKNLVANPQAWLEVGP